MRKGRLFVFGVAMLSGIFVFFDLSGTAFCTTTPTEFVRGAVDSAVNILSDASINPESRSEKIRTLMKETFDVPAMSYRMLEQNWGDQGFAKRQEFMDLFVALLEKTYSRNIEFSKGFAVTYLSEHLDEDGINATVSTLVPYRGGDISVSYRLRREYESWKVYDLQVASISLVNSYRSQFKAILGKTSFDGLLKRLKDRVERKD